MAKYVTTATKQTETALNTLQTYENTVLQLTRMGNPAARRNLPVIGTIGQLAGSGQQLLTSYQRIKALTNPQSLQKQLCSVVSAYGFQTWTS